jgi:hypothetical protein
MVLKLPINVIKKFITVKEIKEVYQFAMYKHNIICVHKDSLSFINFKHLPFLIELGYINEHFLSHSILVTVIIKHHNSILVTVIIKHHISYGDIYNNKYVWKTIKEAIC